tara:strand:- start:379 stop:591 length:213 start_codon:yes stop_codon:yes gene_type:complete
MAESAKQRKELFELVAVIQADLKINNAITQDISNAIGAFKVLAVIFKWIAVMGAGIAAIWNGVNFFHPKQ